MTKKTMRQQRDDALRERDAASKCALDLMIALQILTDQMQECVNSARDLMAKAKRGGA